MSGLFNKTVDIIRKRLGPGGIIGLVNFEDRRYEEFADSDGYDRMNLGNAMHFPEQDVLIIKGQEVPTREGHLLVIGVPQSVYLESDKSLDYTLDEVKDIDALNGADHPENANGLGPFLRANPKHLERLDFLEVFNGESALSFRNANKRAQAFYDGIKNNYPLLAPMSSSDGHSLYEIAGSYTNLLMSENYREIKDSNGLVDALSIGLTGVCTLGWEGRKRNSRLGAIDHVLDLVASRIF